MFDCVENRLLGKGLKYWVHPCLFTVYKLSQENTQSEKMSDNRSSWESQQNQCLCKSSCPKDSLTLLKMGFFKGAHEWKREKVSHISYHTYPTMIKLGKVILYLKMIQKVYESRETSKFYYIKKCRYRLHFNT